MALFVKRKDNNEKIKVRKYIIDSNGEESIWSNEWYGRHVIGLHCEWIDGSKLPIHDISSSCFWGHKWNKWVQYRQELVNMRTGQHTYEIRQKKTCLRCNKMVDEWIA